MAAVSESNEYCFGWLGSSSAVWESLGSAVGLWVSMGHWLANQNSSNGKAVVVFRLQGSCSGTNFWPGVDEKQKHTGDNKDECRPNLDEDDDGHQMPLLVKRAEICEQSPYLYYSRRPCSESKTRDVTLFRGQEAEACPVVSCTGKGNLRRICLFSSPCRFSGAHTDT